MLICAAASRIYETTPEIGLEICRACNDGSAEAMS